MTLPNSFLVGAARSGTTALARSLARHPQVSMPFKEPDFVCGWNLESYVGLNAEFHRKHASRFASFDAYRQLYSDAAGRKVVLDASVTSLSAERSAIVIQGLAPTAKVFAILRQPLDRAFSHFNFNVALGAEPETDFLKAVRSEPERIRQRWYPHSRYMEISHYPPQVRRFRDVFSSSRLLLATYEDWRDHPEEFMTRLLAFLELDEAQDLQPRLRAAETAMPRRAWKSLSTVRSLLKRMLPRAASAPLLSRIRWKVYTKPQLDPGLRSELTNHYFEEDILKLQDMLGRDLSRWLA